MPELITACAGRDYGGLKGRRDALQPPYDCFTGLALGKTARRVIAAQIGVRPDWELRLCSNVPCMQVRPTPTTSRPCHCCVAVDDDGEPEWRTAERVPVSAGVVDGVYDPLIRVEMRRLRGVSRPF